MLTVSRVYVWVHSLHTERPYLIPTLFFAIVQALVLGALMQTQPTRALLFWYCNNVSFFFAIAFWGGNMQMAKGLSYVGILAQILWLADFLSHLFGFDLSNTANYVFVEGFTFANGVTVFIHFGIPLVALLYTARIRPAPRSLYYSALFVAGLYVATVAGTNPVDDMNCVFHACAHGTFPYHVIFWPLYMAVLVLGGYALHEGLYCIDRKFRERIIASMWARWVSVARGFL